MDMIGGWDARDGLGGHYCGWFIMVPARRFFWDAGGARHDLVWESRV